MPGPLPTDHDVTAVPAGCPRCGAHSRPGSQWCTLCYTDLRLTTVRSRPPVNAVVSAPEAAVSVNSLASVVPSRRGKHARHDATYDDGVPAEQDGQAPEAEPVGLPAEVGPTLQASGRRRGHRAEAEPELGTEAMLALLAAESRKPLGGLAGRLDSNATRVGVVVAGIVLFSALLFLVMVVIGSML